MPVSQGRGVFISYRREDSSHLAGRLYDRLADRFGEGQVFMDVDAIEPGVDFAEEINRAVEACMVLAAVIGPNWLTATDERGHRRLDDPDDFVRLEIEAALARGVRVIPVLAEGALVPRRQDLPESLAGLARRNAFLIRHESFRSDARRLVTAIERFLAPAPGTAAVSSIPGAQSVRSAESAFSELAQNGSGHAGNDPSQATRLLTDAERIANSITDEVTKGSALIKVAEALAATDPGQAARLLANAERIAFSITDEFSKAVALSDVAKALAATDPGQAARLLANAERIANSITDESSKVSALRIVAEAPAATDPGQAARLLTNAERIANSITPRIYEGSGAEQRREGTRSHRPRPSHPSAHQRRTHRLVHHRRVFEGIGAEECRGGTRSH